MHLPNQTTFRDMNEQLNEAFTASTSPLFRVAAKADLFDVFLDAMDPILRQSHNCSCCKSFLRRYGNLVTIEDGRPRSALFNFEAEGIYAAPIAKLREAVESGKISSPFVGHLSSWGTAEKGGFDHFCLHQAPFTGKGWQVQAKRIQDMQTLSHALRDFPSDLVASAIALARSGALSRGEKFIAPLEFLNRAREADRLTRMNLVATAPVGWCSPRSQVIGALLQDLKAGLPDAAARFNSKLGGLDYQRPKAAPSAGSVAVAERLFDELGLAPALARRFALFEEIPEFVWKPEVAGKEAGRGLFSDLLPEAKIADMQLASVKMSWTKFARDILPSTSSMQLLIPHLGDFVACVTGPEEPPLFKWSHPRSMYRYHGGSRPDQWGLRPHTSVPVRGLISHVGSAYESNCPIAIIEGCHDTRNNELALFPETLRTELHPVRSVIEAYSKRNKILGVGTANGLSLLNATLRVAQINYTIDRYE